MKGKIERIDTNKVTMKDGTVKDKYILHFTDDQRPYECWSLQSHKVGDEVEGEVVTREFGGQTFYTFKLNKPAGSFQGKGGYQPSKDESFAAAYAKDVAVAFIDKGIITDSRGCDATIMHYYTLFIGMLKGGKKDA